MASSGIHHSLRYGISALALLAAMPAAAQEAQNDGANSNDSGVADIVVTATRREQALQSVPLAVTALGSSALRESNVTNVQSIVQLSPGIQIQPAFVPGNAVFQIRGQGTSDVAPAIQRTVGLYFDDVYIAASAGALINFVDIARVEVLKGPQGTLFGKNTTGGAIRVVSNRPTHEFGGYGLVGYESFDRAKFEGVINVPLGEKVAFRAAGQIIDKNGGAYRSKLTGKPIDLEHSQFVRGSLLVQPDDRLDILLQGDYSHSTGGGVALYIKQFVPGDGTFTALDVAIEHGLWNFTPAGIPAAVAAATPIIANETFNRPPRVVGVDMRPVTATSYTFNAATGQFSYNGGHIDPRNRNKTWGLNANIEYNLDFGTIKSITAYRKSDYSADYNYGGMLEHILNAINKNNGSQFSQEVLLNAKVLGDRLDLTTGGIYFRSNNLTVDRALALAGVTALFNPVGTRGTDAYVRAVDKSLGFFGQGTYTITDKLSVTAGLRWSRDKRHFGFTTFNNESSGASSCFFTASNGLSLVPSFRSPCTIDADVTFKEWSYTGSINYQIDPEKLVYIRTSRGYRAGGFQPRLVDPLQLKSYKPEIVTDYELGLKADWWDSKLRTNLAIFRSKTKDVIADRNDISPTTNQSIQFLENRGTRNIDGVELQVAARPVRYLSLDGGLTYLKVDGKDPLFPEVTWVPNAPKWSWNLGGTLDLPLSSAIDVRLRADVAHRGKARHSGGQIPLGNGSSLVSFDPPLTLVNARLSLTHVQTGIEAAIFARNLTDRRYAARLVTNPGLGLVTATAAEPRAFGVELKIPFGAQGGR